MEALLYSIVIVVSVLLIICLIKVITSAFLNKKKTILTMFTIVPVKAKDEDIEYTVRSLLWSSNWESLIGNRIILVLTECDEETIKLCNKLSEEYEPVITCYPEELKNLITNPELIL